MTITLPPPVAAYFSVDANGAPEAFVQLFAEQAVVVDERQTYTGRGQIREWKQGTASQYTYTAEPFAIQGDAQQATVTARLTGNFPGSPVDLRYRFAIQGDLITVLEIAP